MSDDYLWDGTGEPDPEIRKLETMLATMRHDRPAPDFSGIVITQPQAARVRFWHKYLFPRFAAAAAVGILAAFAIVFFMQRPQPNPGPTAGWDVTRISGAPRIGVKPLNPKNTSGKLVAGETLETDARSQAKISVEEVGEIVVDPDSRLRLPVSSSGVRRLALDRGTIHASIWAPAGEFVIDTPSAVAVDLGCAYTLHVDDSGNGLLQTTLGWVGFKLADHEAFIPAGAACSTRSKTGPGTPYFEDATEAFRSAVSRFDLATSTPDEKVAALQVILAQARKRDALTLWHLLSRVDQAQRGMVYDRLAHFVPAPAGVSREGILRLDQNMLDLWWNQLGYGDVGLWRHWERSWPSK
jgi:hypothetical protein